MIKVHIEDETLYHLTESMNLLALCERSPWPGVWVEVMTGDNFALCMGCALRYSYKGEPSAQEL